MKVLLVALAIVGSMAAHAAEVEVQECNFRGTTVSFTPAPTLSALLKKEVKGAMIYRVKYIKGRTHTGPKDELAVIDQIGKNLEVTIFEHDSKDGIVTKDYGISIDLKSPVTIDSPAIGFSSHMIGSSATPGKCFITL